MKKLKSLLLATTIIVSISSCGYQLRGSVNIEGLENIKIIAENENNITRILEQKLLAYKKGTLNESMYPAIRVLSVESNKRQLSVNSSGRVDEYEINKIIKYQFIYSKERIISGTLKANASYDFNESQMQGTRERENTAIESIDRNLVRKLLLKFKAGFKVNAT
jgi:outer membrane lipopolysaccharide assembly protein LptE/RlpB